MKIQLVAVCLFMPILACSAQFSWLWNYRQPYRMVPERQTSFGFMVPSTTIKPSYFDINPKMRRDGSSIDAAITGDINGGSSNSPDPVVPAADNGGAVADTGANGDTSTNTDTGSDWDFNLGGTDYGGNSGGGDGGADAGTGGTSTGGGLGGTSGAAGGTFADGGALNPAHDDSMQNLASSASAGSIAGIVIGVIILLSVLAGVSFFVMRQVHRKVQVNVATIRS